MLVIDFVVSLHFYNPASNTGALPKTGTLFREARLEHSQKLFSSFSSPVNCCHYTQLSLIFYNQQVKVYATQVLGDPYHT